MADSTSPHSPGAPAAPKPLRVVSHSGLFFWWPVWAAGFFLSVLTLWDGGRMAVVPEGTTVSAIGDKRYELTLPDSPTSSLAQAAGASTKGQDAFPVRMSGNREFGLIFVIVFLVVVFGSNVPLRGLWSLIGILVVFGVAMLLAYFEVWGWILERLWGMHIYITLAGYLTISLVLLALWAATVFGSDRLRYIYFTEGQFIVHKDIGDVQQAFGTIGMTVRKRQTDLFRHWVLGLGAGDLIIDVPNQVEIVLPNVLFVDRKVKQIAELIKIRPVVAG